MMSKKPTQRIIVEEGTCICIYEPRCDHGLEGYVEGLKYRYQKMKDEKGYYMRVYPDAENFPDYHETCGNRVFTKYFKVKK